jgi:hypothetical protein
MNHVFWPEDTTSLSVFNWTYRLFFDRSPIPKPPPLKLRMFDIWSESAKRTTFMILAHWDIDRPVHAIENQVGEQSAYHLDREP